MDPLPKSNWRGHKGEYGIVRADENIETPGDLSLTPHEVQAAPLPDPRPALRNPHDGSDWRPVILKASLGDDSKSLNWTPIDLGAQCFGTMRSERRQLRTIQTDELLSGTTQSFRIAPHRSILRPVPHTLSLSMFDQILRGPPPTPNFHPAHATMFVRRLILAKMTLTVDIYLRQAYSLTVKAMQNISRIADFDPQRLGEKPWQDEWRSEFFNRLWELRGNIELLGFDVEKMIRLFSDLTNNASWPEMQGFEKAVAEEWETGRCFKHVEIRNQELDDLKAWENLEATRKYAAGFIERTTNSYLQAATAEGAKFANIQARTYV